VYGCNSDRLECGDSRKDALPQHDHPAQFIGRHFSDLVHISTCNEDLRFTTDEYNAAVLCAINLINDTAQRLKRILIKYICGGLWPIKNHMTDRLVSTF
jgi:hypothetical protein